MRIISLTLLFIPLISWSQKIMPEGYSDKDYIINFSNLYYEIMYFLIIKDLKIY